MKILIRCEFLPVKQTMLTKSLSAIYRFYFSPKHNTYTQTKKKKIKCLAPDLNLNRVWCLFLAFEWSIFSKKKTISGAIELRLYSKALPFVCMCVRVVTHSYDKHVMEYFLLFFFVTIWRSINCFNCFFSVLDIVTGNIVGEFKNQFKMVLDRLPKIVCLANLLKGMNFSVWSWQQNGISIS